MPVTVVIKTIGCRLNQAESQELAEALTRAGFFIVGAERPADLFILNSCAVTAAATRKSRQTLRAYHHRWPCTNVAVLGCSEPELQSLPEVDLAIPLADKARMVAIITRKLKMPPPQAGSRQRWGQNVKCHRPGRGPASKAGGGKITERSLSIGRTRALVKIQDGCDEFCTYCLVPFRRGKPRSISPGEILTKIKRLESTGSKEIVLTGVHIGQYFYRGLTLDGLVKEILTQTKIPRIRFSSIEPQHFTAAILRLFRSPRICPYLHLPIQSGNGRILRAMRRRYTARQLGHWIARIKKTVPGIFLSTDVMVGFPGETVADFGETVKFCRRIGFAKIHVFSYSRRAGTVANNYSHQITPRVIASRSRRLRQLSDRLNRKYRQRLLDKKTEVLLETPCAGTSRAGVKVSFSRRLQPNALVLAQIHRITADQTFAKLI